MKYNELVTREYKNIEKAIKYEFKNKEILINALTHSSYANEVKKPDITSNERIEFLGDSILSMVVSERIYKDFSLLQEGEMTKYRATVVCEPTLAEKAKELNLGKYLLFGKGEDSTGGRTRNSVLADAFESIIGAIFIDGGVERAKEFVLFQLKDIMKDYIANRVLMDFKTTFQEFIQRDGEHKISYNIIKEEGPDHDKNFVSEVIVDDESISIGEGKTKKDSEQNAAKHAIIIKFPEEMINE